MTKRHIGINDRPMGSNNTPNLNNNWDSQFRIPQLSTEANSMNKKEYRTQSILGWKKKRSNLKIRHYGTLRLLNSFDVKNSSSVVGECSKLPSSTSNETTAHNNSNKHSQRAPKSIKQGMLSF